MEGPLAPEGLSPSDDIGGFLMEGSLALEDLPTPLMI